MVGGGAEKVHPCSLTFSPSKQVGFFGSVWFLMLYFVMYGDLGDATDYLGLVFTDFYFLGFMSLETIF